jgi:hypothetical protein
MTIRPLIVGGHLALAAGLELNSSRFGRVTTPRGAGRERRAVKRDRKIEADVPLSVARRQRAIEAVI